jgi:hypothetical protein
MKPLLQQLENESLLLLYMAGELPARDREELDLMLSRDGGLRAQLEALRGAQATSFNGLAGLDASEPIRPIEPMIRQVNRAMQQWQIDRLARPAQPSAAGSTIRVWAWSAGSVVAACLVFCIWWGFRSDNSGTIVSTQPANMPSNLVAQATGGDSLASRQASTVDGPANSSAPSDAVQIVTVDSNTQQLADLESVVSQDLTPDVAPN